MNRTDRAIQQLCRDVIVLDSDEDDAPCLSDMARRAQGILAAVAPKRSRAMPRHPAVGAGKVRKAAKKEERRAKVAAIREAVFARAGANCEFCRMPVGVLPLEWHHIIGGGLRRHRESVETTVAICRPCHDDWERGSLLVLAEAVEWAARHKFGGALAAINRRVAKVEEARRIA